MADREWSEEARELRTERCTHGIMGIHLKGECLACIEDVLDRVRAQSNPSPAAPAADPREVCATAIEAGRCDKSKRGYDCCEDGCRALDDAADTIRSLPPARMKIAYADPPYPGLAHLYADQDSYGGEVDHADLIARLERDYDGWVLHTHVGGLSTVVPLLPKAARILAWVKPFAAFKRNVSLAYAWEPVIVKAARKPVVSKRLVLRDWIDSSCTLKRGLIGVKPEKVCHWAFECVGARPEDELVDLYPGTGAVTRAWNIWKGMLVLPIETEPRA